MGRVADWLKPVVDALGGSEREPESRVRWPRVDDVADADRLAAFFGGEPYEPVTLTVTATDRDGCGGATFRCSLDPSVPFAETYASARAAEHKARSLRGQPRPRARALRRAPIIIRRPRASRARRSRPSVSRTRGAPSSDGSEGPARAVVLVGGRRA
jgi:hypothetical protein